MLQYEQFCVPYVPRYGRQPLAGITSQTAGERKDEVVAPAMVITQIRKERDHVILRALSEEQRSIFQRLEGPLIMAWSQHEMVCDKTFIRMKSALTIKRTVVNMKARRNVKARLDLGADVFVVLGQQQLGENA